LLSPPVDAPDCTAISLIDFSPRDREQLTRTGSGFVLSDCAQTVFEQIAISDRFGGELKRPPQRTRPLAQYTPKVVLSPCIS